MQRLFCPRKLRSVPKLPAVLLVPGLRCLDDTGFDAPARWATSPPRGHRSDVGGEQTVVPQLTKTPRPTDKNAPPN
jgi:hypothetical protein